MLVGVLGEVGPDVVDTFLQEETSASHQLKLDLPHDRRGFLPQPQPVCAWGSRPRPVICSPSPTATIRRSSGPPWVAAARTSCAMRSDAFAPVTATRPRPVIETCTTAPSGARPSGTSRHRSSGVLDRRSRGGTDRRHRRGRSDLFERSGSGREGAARARREFTIDVGEDEGGVLPGLGGTDDAGPGPARSSHASITASSATSIGPAIFEAPASEDRGSGPARPGSTAPIPVSRRDRRRCSLPRR